MLGFYSGVCQKVHIHIKRTEISDIPDTVVEQRQWIFDSFKDKDKYSIIIIYLFIIIIIIL